MARLKLIQELVLECVRKNTEEDFEFFLEDFSKKNPKIVWLDLIKYGPKISHFIYTTIEKYQDYISIPKNISKHLAINYLLAVQRNKKIKQEVVLLANEFNKSGLSHFFLKGAAVIWTVYHDDEGLRPMDDIDLLVREEDLEKAEEIIRHLGFKEEYARLSRESNRNITREIYTDKYYQYEYFKNGIELELHWNFTRKFPTSTIQQLISNSTKVAVDGARISMLNPEGILFLACMNFIKDFDYMYHDNLKYSKNVKDIVFYQYMFIFYQVKRILKCYGTEISWDSFISLVKLAKIEYEVFTLLMLAKKIVNADIPEKFLRKTRGNVFVFLCVLLCKKLGYDDVNMLIVLREKTYAIPCRILVFINPVNLACMAYRKIRALIKQHNYKAYVFLGE